MRFFDDLSEKFEGSKQRKLNKKYGIVGKS
jgi:hypothetical protein